ncbi:tRNA (guanine(46)-N(7))-methyltransferase TrmB [Coprothermobacter platensis]|uniref:tRNA (guanine(46)-N(7))-methyltransferase TrmB n=1 Tax=Coprothermobacter platensis TaxID=108819 RepID=UPI0003632B6F|nr:hypothetical protein [Coprothermobacter platensis]
MLLKPQDKLLPLDWDSIFDNDGPLAVEIGFGNGKFMEQLVETGERVVGFEVSLVSIEKALKTADKNRTALIFMDGVWGVRELFAPESIDHIFVNFPLPWPEKKHADRRLFTLPKLQIYCSRLKHNGTITLQTDVEQYAEEAMNNAQKSGLFNVSAYHIRNNVQIRTKYEEKWINQGKRIYTVSLQKAKHVSVKPYIIQEVVMPHAVIKNITGTVREKTVKTNFGTIRMWPAYKNEEGTLLIPAIVSDDDFVGVSLQQHVYVAVASHEDGFIVKLDNHSDVFKTENVKALIWIIAHELSNDIARINVNSPSYVEEHAL